MQGLRKFVVPMMRATASVAAKKVAMARPAAVCVMSTLVEREKGEEARYFRQHEEARKAEIRAKLEKVLAMEEGSAEKQEIIEQLAHVGEEKGLLAKYGLDDWKFALPIGILVGMPVISNEVYVMNAETHIVVAFLIFIYTMYSQTGAMIAKSLDEQRDTIFNQLKAVDESLLTDLKASIQANEKVLDLESDVASIFKLTDDLHIAQADAFNHAEQHKYREAIVKKLDSLVSMEEAATAAIRNRMLTTVKADVLSTFAKDAGAKDKALAQAIAVLTAGQGAKIGKDVVGDAFGSAIKNYRDKYSKLPAGADEILVNLEKEMQAVAAAPAVEVKGGNVYEAFPILRKK